MAASKKKQVKREYTPSSKQVMRTQDPEKYYQETPSWSFRMCDAKQWAFNKEYVGEAIWTEIIPRMQEWETQTWSEILVKGKKFNHSINAESLNPQAQKRLAEMYIEQDSIISLRLNGKHRIYGYITEAVFNILWYDSNHGDNSTCVCRSRLKNT